MRDFAPGSSFVDLDFLERQRVIATAVLHGRDGVALVDPGPTSTLPTLRRKLHDAGIELAEVSSILLTHIHLDHAGVCGDLVSELPGVRVFVHERGAPHMVDPSKLIASASRLYGDANMERLWGSIRPVPEQALVVLRGGEAIEAGGQHLDVEYTPGHASHHVSYFNRSTAVAFVGDTAGVRLADAGQVLPPTPPPDIDLDAWTSSLDLIEHREPGTLFLTHFGPYSAPAGHIAELRQRLRQVADMAKASLEREGTDDERERWFTGEVRKEMLQHTGGIAPESYEAAARLDLNWRGLARYWRKRAGL
ncbi:MAG: MBL fold metallo-hydrolase [Vicinamibacterales bacterium]